MKFIEKINNKIKDNKIINNFIILFTGDSISSILNIISTAIIINAIGLESNGVLLMIQTYVLFFDQIFNFKIFESLIKYLTNSIHNGNIKECKSYIKQGVYLDLITACIATMFGLICVNFIINIMGWSFHIKPYIILYMCTTIFNISGVSIGVIRTYNYFNYISYINVAINILRLIAFVIGLASGFEFAYYLFVEFFISIGKNIALSIMAYRILIKNEMGDFYKVPLKFEKGFFMFSLNTNLASTIDLPVNTLTTFIMNKYLGFEVISVYKVFEKIGSIVGKFSSPLNQIIYPELNIYVAKKQSEDAIKLSRKLALGISGLGVAVFIGILVTYKFWLGILIPNYKLYIVSLLIYIMFIIFTNATATVHSLFMALGYIKFVVPILISINIVYILAMIPIIRDFGLNGVILLLFIQAIAVVGTKMIIMYRNNYNEIT